MAAVVDNGSGCSHRIEACHRNQPYKTRLLLVSLKFMQLYISNKTADLNLILKMDLLIRHIRNQLSVLINSSCIAIE